LSQIKATESNDRFSFVSAEASADSGIAYARTLVRRYSLKSPSDFTQGEYSKEITDRIFADFHLYLQETLNGSVATNYNNLPSTLSEFKEGSLTGTQVTLPMISVAPGELSNFSLTFKLYDDSPTEWVIVSVGRHNDADNEVTRTAPIRYRPEQSIASIRNDPQT
jgi:hypothetical protein